MNAMAQRKPQDTPPRERATPERILHAVSVSAEISVTPDRQTQRITQAPLDRLRASGTITQREFEAGDSYRTTAFLARIDPSAPTIDWNAIGGSFGSRPPSMFSTQAIADARIRWRRMERDVPHHTLVHAVLEAAVIREKPLADIGHSLFGRRDREGATVAATAALRLALDALATRLEG